MAQVVLQAIKEKIIQYITEQKNYECCLCEIKLSGELVIEDHLSSGKHRENNARYAIKNWNTSPQSVKALLPRPVKEAAQAGVLKVASSNEIFCHICKIPCTGVVSLNDHLTSKSHIKRKEALSDSGAPAVKIFPDYGTDSMGSISQQLIRDGIVDHRNVNEFHCNICDLVFNSETSLKQHLDANKHTEACARKAITEYATSPRSLVDKLPDVIKKAAQNGFLTITNTKSFLCNPCNVQVNGVTPLKDHILGDDHRKKTQELQRLPAAIGTSKPITKSTFSTPADMDSEEIVREIEEGIIFELDNPSDKYGCKLCGKRFSSEGPLSDHLKSRKHKLKKMQGASGQPLQTDNRGENLASQLSRERNKEQMPQTAESLRREYSFLSEGYVHIFNNTFKGTPKVRKGAEQDSINLKETFESMSYRVFLHEDLGRDQTVDRLSEIKRDPALNGIDVFIMFFLSHGKDAYTFYANDEGEIDLDTIRRMFTDRKCPHLRGKPKIFFVNYCRGNQLQKRELEYDDIEAPCDIATIHAATEGIMAKRDRKSGTIFVSSLCELLKTHSHNCDLRDIYLELDHRMQAKGGTKPMWEDYTFKRFYFHPKQSSEF